MQRRSSRNVSVVVLVVALSCLLLAVLQLSGAGFVGVRAPRPASCCYTSLAFNDDFDSLSSIDLTGTGAAGHKWFTDAPFNWGRTSASSLSISDGVLTLNMTPQSSMWGIGTSSATSKQGRGFQYGYFEARIAFDPTKANGTTGYPAFWGLSHAQITGANMPRSAELDFFEAYREGTLPYQDVYAGTVHDWLLWPNQVDRASFGNNTRTLPGTKWNEFHTYGCLWQPGRITWYFDGQAMLTQHYSASAPPSPNPQNHPAGTFSVLDTDSQGQALVLGAGIDYPMRIDWVRVWQ